MANCKTAKEPVLKVQLVNQLTEQAKQLTNYQLRLVLRLVEEMAGGVNSGREEGESDRGV